MKKITGFCCAILLAASSALAEGNVDAFLQVGAGRTHPTFEPFTNVAKPVVPALLDVRTDLYADRLFLNAHGWGMVDLQHGDPNGHLENALLGYRFPRGNMEVGAGRFYRFMETGVEQLDGITAATDLAGGFSVMGYAGAPVKVPFSNQGNSIYGGKVSWRYPRYFDAGVSAVRENGALTVIDGVVEKDRRELIGASFRLGTERMLELKGDATYNNVTKGWGENRYEIVFRPHDAFFISGELRVEEYAHYFPSATVETLRNNIPNDADGRGRQMTMAVAASLRPTRGAELTLFFRDIDKEVRAGDQDFRYYGLRSRFASGKWVNGFHYTRADRTGHVFMTTSPYHEFYGYTEYRGKELTANLNAHVVFYDDTVGVFLNPSAQDYAVSTAVTYRMTKELSVAGSVGYNRSPTIGKDVTANLWLRYHLKI